LQQLKQAEHSQIGNSVAKLPLDCWCCCCCGTCCRAVQLSRYV